MPHPEIRPKNPRIKSEVEIQYRRFCLIMYHYLLFLNAMAIGPGRIANIQS